MEEKMVMILQRKVDIVRQAGIQKLDYMVDYTNEQLDALVPFVEEVTGKKVEIRKWKVALV